MKYSRHIAIVAIIAFLGVTVAAASWSDPAIVPVGGNRDTPVNSSIFDQIKNQGLGVQTFFVANNAQFDQAVFASGMIRGGTPATNPMLPSTVSFGDATHQVGIDANGTFYVTETITSPTLGNIGQRQVCADQYGFLSLCQ